MIRLYLCLFVLTLSMASYSQSEISAKDNSCLFGFIPENGTDFDEVIDYVNRIGNEVVCFCEEEYLIFVLLNEKYYEYGNLFSNIESKYPGKCYFKSVENEIPKYQKCKEQYVKETIKNQQ